MQPEALSAAGLTVRFDSSASMPVRLLTGAKRRTVHAVEDVSFSVARGTTFALVGESGCGKTTVARAMAGLQRPTSGTAMVLGEAPGRSRALQMIFQDPYASLDPSWRVGRIVAEPLITQRGGGSRAATRSRVAELLEMVGLTPSDAQRRPHQFSGGQRQRISIARALSANPAVVICDEPTSALDVSVQAQIVNLMRRLQAQFGLTYLLISHNLAVVAQMADRIGVMYLGRLVEQGEAAQLITSPLHPYTRLLLAMVPRLDAPGALRPSLAGEVPSPLAPPPGCAFHPRCPHAERRCRSERPGPRSHGGSQVACHAVEEGRIT